VLCGGFISCPIITMLVRPQDRIDEPVCRITVDGIADC
jgi:hypothetical protein